MKKITFKKTALIICMFCIAMIFLTVAASAQDTVYTSRVHVRNSIGISKKTGHIIYASPLHWEKVKTGYIIKETNGMCVVNGREVYPGDYRKTGSMIAKSEMKNQK